MNRTVTMRSAQSAVQTLIGQRKPGRLEWIGLRERQREPVRVVTHSRALAGLGLEGDRRCNGTPGSGRQVTLISCEHISVIENLLGRSHIDPALFRRNLLVSKINLHALRHQQFAIGTAVFEGGAQCHPCSRMEKALGPGGFAAMMGHGGLCAKVLQEGEIAIGDAVLHISVSSPPVT